MPWFRNDDTLPFHWKVLIAGNSAMGLWVRAGAWASAYLTDGFLPGHVALAIGTAAEVEHLVAAGLWEPVDGGYRFHDWEDYNPSREETEAKRRGTVARQRKYRQRHAEPAAIEAPRNALHDASLTAPRPDPTRPVSSNEETLSGSRRSPERPLPEDWMPTASHRRLAAERGVTLEWQADRFRDHAATNDRRCRNWNMAFTSWLKQSDPSRDRGVLTRKNTPPVIDRSKPWAPDGYPA